MRGGRDRDPGAGRAGCPRPRLAVAAILVIAAGLASRSDSVALPEFIKTYAGDTLWAVLVFLILAFTFPKLRAPTLAASAFAIALSVELLQLYHAPWLDAIRDTLPGRLLLGQGFLFSDLFCYTAGIAIVAILYCMASASGLKDIGIIAAAALVTCAGLAFIASKFDGTPKTDSRPAPDRSSSPGDTRAG